MEDVYIQEVTFILKLELQTAENVSSCKEFTVESSERLQLQRVGAVQSRTFTVRKSITCGEQWTFTVGKSMSCIESSERF